MDRRFSVQVWTPKEFEIIFWQRGYLGNRVSALPALGKFFEQTLKATGHIFVSLPSPDFGPEGAALRSWPPHALELSEQSSRRSVGKHDSNHNSFLTYGDFDFGVAGALKRHCFSGHRIPPLPYGR